MIQQLSAALEIASALWFSTSVTRLTQIFARAEGDARRMHVTSGKKREITKVYFLCGTGNSYTDTRLRPRLGALCTTLSTDIVENTNLRGARGAYATFMTEHLSIAC